MYRLKLLMKKHGKMLVLSLAVLLISGFLVGCMENGGVEPMEEPATTGQEAEEDLGDWEDDDWGDGWEDDWEEPADDPAGF